jgi:hypothetical protein
MTERKQIEQAFENRLRFERLSSDLDKAHASVTAQRFGHTSAPTT